LIFLFPSLVQSSKRGHQITQCPAMTVWSLGSSLLALQYTRKKSQGRASYRVQPLFAKCENTAGARREVRVNEGAWSWKRRMHPDGVCMENGFGRSSAIPLKQEPFLRHRICLNLSCTTISHSPAGPRHSVVAPGVTCDHNPASYL
jgi:hypothetical protein